MIPAPLPDSKRAYFYPTMFTHIAHFQCDLHLYRTAYKKRFPEGSRRLLPKKPQQAIHLENGGSPAPSAQRGFMFEVVVERSLRALCAGDSSLHVQVFDQFGEWMFNGASGWCFVSGFLQKLPANWPDDKTTIYFMQAPILPSPIAVEALGLTGTAELSKSIMDIVRVTRREGGQFDVTIIDIKATYHVKTSHELQVGTYGIIMHAMLKDSPCVAVCPQAEIWLPAPSGSQPAYLVSPFSLLAAMRHVKTFLLRDFARVLSIREEDCSWELRSTCETCGYLPSCRTRAATQMSDIEDCAQSTHSPSVTTALPSPPTELTSIAVVVDPSSGSVKAFALRRCSVKDEQQPSWMRAGVTVKDFLDALLEAMALGSQIVAFSEADVAEILRSVYKDLTLDLEKYNELVALFEGDSLHLTFPPDLPRVPQILQKSTSRKSGSLSQDASASRERSSGRESSAAREESVGREEDPAAARDPLPSERCPPITSVTAAARHLLSSKLCFTSYSLEDCARVLLKESEVMTQTLYNELCEENASSDFCITRCVLIHDMCKAIYHAFPPDSFPQHPALYALPLVPYPDDPVLRSMLAKEHHEMMSQLRAARASRVLSKGAVLLRYKPRHVSPPQSEWSSVANYFELLHGDVSIDDIDLMTKPFSSIQVCGKCRTVPELSRRTDGRVLVSCGCSSKGVTPFKRPWEDLLQGKLFGNWYLVEESLAPTVARALVDDACFFLTPTLHFRIIPAQYKKHVHLADVIGISDGSVCLALHTWTNLQPDAQYRLLPRVFDLWHGKISSFLSAMDPKTSLFLSLVKDSRSASSPMRGRLGVPPKVPGLRSSQQEGLSRFWQDGFQVLWGPPGTGKTHYMATCIVALLRRAAEAGEACRIIVTCFTKSAIKNLMKAVQKLENGPPPITLVSCHDSISGMVHGRDKASMKEALKAPLVVVGATVHFLHRVVTECNVQFEALFIDEGTQMPCAYLAVPVSMLCPDRWCFMVGGDFLQLPPILHGGPYFTQSPTEPNVYSSAMHALLQCSTGQSLSSEPCQALLQLQSGEWPSLAILTETSRCNTAITQHARHLYGSWYTSLVDHRVVLGAGGAESLLPAEHGNAPSLVSLHCTSVPPSFEAIAKVVRSFVQELVQRQQTKLSFAIVTPLRVLRDACSAALRGMMSDVDVDTVERMQGQERDVIIIVMAVPHSHDDRITSFLLDLCRFNVAITRTRAMCVTVISENVLSPPLAAVADANCLACRDCVMRFFESSHRIPVTF